jgi:methylated-DNA-[protein]-cysteine S-methyltransferase
MMKQYLNYLSPLGYLCLVASKQGLAGVFFDHHAHYEHDQNWVLNTKHPILLNTIIQLEEYFLGQRQQFDLPLDQTQGTAFQQKVWATLRKIPYGETWSYQQLALAINNPKASRAVGAANGRNPLTIIVPCHRVIASSGAMQGYSGGLSNKIKLLETEKKHISTQKS